MNYWRNEMSPLAKTTFKDWQTEQKQDPGFVTASRELEPGYQVARLRIQRGLTQTQLAELVGTHQPSIARLENGTSIPSLSFLNRIAESLDARVELKILLLS
jgi:DNA-binding XRE family transcriptional regulator